MAERFESAALDREQTLAAIRDVAEHVCEPEPEPRLAHDALPPATYHQRRSENTLEPSPQAAKTAAYLHWRAQVAQRNRGALSGLLWACNALRAFRDEPVFRELGQPLSFALVRFGVSNGHVPASAVERRAMVEAYGTPRWAELMRVREAAE